jgi:hypothetical protein
LDDIWLRPDVKFNGYEYYECVLMYAEDIMAIPIDATAILKSMERDTMKYENDKD